jgi:hypothetical protein
MPMMHTVIGEDDSQWIVAQDLFEAAYQPA